MVTAIFWTMTLLCCGYAAVFGSEEGRWTALMMLLAVVLTGIAEASTRSWNTTNFAVMLVDVLLCCGLGIRAFRSASLWPMWMTSAQLLAVLTHIASMLAGVFDQKIYAALAAVWAIPCLTCMVAGITLDRRSGLFAERHRRGMQP